MLKNMAIAINTYKKSLQLQQDFAGHSDFPRSLIRAKTALIIRRFDPRLRSQV